MNETTEPTPDFAKVKFIWNYFWNYFDYMVDIFWGKFTTTTPLLLY